MEGHIKEGLMITYAPVLFVFIPILTSLLVFIIKKSISTYFVFIAQIGLIIVFALYIITLQKSPEISLLVFGGWDSRFAISFYNDRLSLTFIGMTLFITFTVLLYAYRKNQKENLFFFFLMFIEGVLLGLMQTNDLFNLFVFMELITLLTTILISYKKKGSAFKAAIYYLLVNSVGALAFLIGIIFIYYIYGTLNIQELIQTIDTHSQENIIKLAFVLMMAGITVKAALFPVHTWLPKAHAEARSCISALLSGLVVKAGLYLFIRIYLQMFSKADFNVSEVFFYIGVISAIIGIVFAVSQKDIKLILAYHTVSQIGIMMMGLSSANDLSYVGGLMHLLNHALFKSLLFLGAGIVIKRYQTRNIDKIRGVFKSMPMTAILLIVGILSISGAPLFNAFVSKSLIKYGFNDNWIKIVLFMIINIGTITSFVKFSQILFGPKTSTVGKMDVLQILALSILAIGCVIMGILYIPIGRLIFDVNLSSIHILNWKIWLEYLLYLAIGIILYLFVIKKDLSPLRFIRNTIISFESANYVFVIYIVFLTIFILFR